MSTYGTAGSSPFGQPTKTFQEIVRDKLRSAWTHTDPGKELDDSDAERSDLNKVKFGLEYTAGDISKKYEIRCVRFSDLPTGERSEGMRSEMFQAKVDVNIFAKRQGRQPEPIQLQNMENEVRRIIRVHQASFGQGIGRADLISVAVAHDPESYGLTAYWHLRLVVGLTYTVMRTA